jgi:hypothetical protein
MSGMKLGGVKLGGVKLGGVKLGGVKLGGMKLVPMKRFALFLCCPLLLCAAELTDVHTVYVLRMSKGLDQYLANRLTADKVFQIVTDPKLADAVFTDQIGEGFEAKLEEIFPPPEIAKPAPAPKKDEDEDVPPANKLMTDTVNKLAAPTSSFGRSHGTVFLVWAKSRQVVWSAYEPAKGSASKDLNRTANDIVSRIRKDLKGK